MTSFVPRSSSTASPFADSRFVIPSEGFLRDAYPAIHIGSVGVTSTVATPAFQVGISPGSAARTDGIMIGDSKLRQTMTNEDE